MVVRAVEEEKGEEVLVLYILTFMLLDLTGRTNARDIGCSLKCILQCLILLLHVRLVPCAYMTRVCLALNVTNNLKMCIYRLVREVCTTFTTHQPQMKSVKEMALLTQLDALNLLFVDPSLHHLLQILPRFHLLHR